MMVARRLRSAIGRPIGQVLAIWLLLNCPAFASWRMPEFLILYSYGWPAEQVAGRLTAVTAGQIAAAHYNTVMCATPEIELASEAGLRCLTIAWSQGPPDYIGEAVSPEIARSLATNAAVWGYYVMDEPDNKNENRGATFQQLGERVTNYRAADPVHVAWINVTSATGSFLSDYMETVKPDLLSFDLYRWWAKETDWWRGLEAHRDAALRAGVPMVMWIESNSSEQRFIDHLPPSEDNATKIRWSVYTSLAYGSKGVQWFIGSTDKDVAGLNGELAMLGPTLVNLQSKHVFHTSSVPREGARLPESNWYFTEAPNLVIGEFIRPGDPSATYFLIANKSIEEDTDVVFEIRQSVVSSVEEVNKESIGRTTLPLERRAGATRVRLHFGVGDGRLIRVVAR